MDDAALLVYRALLAHYGEPSWWPAADSYEVIVGAVLTQNTAWRNVEQALAGFGGDLTPQRVAGIDSSELMAIIRPAGFFHQKAACLKAVTAWFAGYGYDVVAVRREPLAKVRAELLAVKGVGPETADAILLYAFDFPVFVVDAYTNRLCRRYPLPAGQSYAAVQAYFTANLPVDASLYNRFHALIVVNAKQHCRKQPLCVGCPLAAHCQGAAS